MRLAAQPRWIKYPETNSPHPAGQEPSHVLTVTCHLAYAANSLILRDMTPHNILSNVAFTRK
jgi:hypothetical protein